MRTFFLLFLFLPIVNHAQVNSNMWEQSVNDYSKLKSRLQSKNGDDQEMSQNEFEKEAKQFIEEQYKVEDRDLAMEYLELRNTGHSKNSDAVIFKLLQIILKYENQLGDYDQVMVNNRLGDYYKDNQQYVLANFFYKKCLPLKETNRYKMNGKIAQCFFAFNLYDSTLLYYHKSLQNEYEKEDLLNTYNSIGFAYYKLDNLDSARFYYNSVHDLFLSINTPLDSLHYYNVLSNIASVDTKENKTADAIEILSEIEQSEYFKNASRLFKLEVLCKKYQAISKSPDNNFKENIIGEIDKLIEEYPSLKNEIRYLETKLDYYISIGDKNQIRLTNQAIEQIKQKQQKKNDLQSILIQNLNLNVFNEHIETVGKNLELEEKEKILLEKSNDRKRTLIILSILISVVIILGILIWIKQRKKQTETTLQLNTEKLEKRKLEVKALLNTGESNAILLNQLESKLSNTLSDGVSDVEIKEIILFIRERNKFEELKTGLSDRALIDEPLFYSRIKEIYPHLTDLDLQLMFLIKLGLSNKEIAMFRSVEPSSVRTFKNRLKIKLEVESDIDLKEFIAQL